MASVFKAENVEQAVHMAQEFKASGAYDWFRGQAHEWMPQSTFSRLDQQGQSQAALLANEFYRWAADDPDLAYLTKDDQLDALCAIAQHYGIPTNYIDFTTDPAIAGFFACDTDLPPDGSLSCIYCLNTGELESFCEMFLGTPSREGAKLNLLEVEVKNLWRLQAQHGVFLFSNYNWEIDYDLDKIIFPHRGYPSYPRKEYVYPVDKSSLEIKLDQFFALMKLREGHSQFISIIEGINREGGDIPLTYIEAEPNDLCADYFLNPGDLQNHESWSVERTAPWKGYKSENFRELDSRSEKILISATKAEEIARQIEYAVGQILEARPRLRDALVEWRLEGGLTGQPAMILAARLKRAWDGMRGLPYGDEQIAASLANIAGLTMSSMDDEARDLGYTELFTRYFGAGTRVEVANPDGTYTRGYFSKSSFDRILIPNSGGMLKIEYKHLLDYPNTVLQIIQNPRIMFDFDATVDIFARELIPSQIVMERDVLVYNPVNVLRIGLP